MFLKCCYYGIKKKRGVKMQKLDKEEIYHLIDLLEMDIQETQNKRLLSDSQKQEAIKYNTDLIAKLESILNEKAV